MNQRQNDEQPNNIEPVDLADNEHYFPSTPVYEDGRLALDSTRAKKLGIEEGDWVTVVIPSIDFRMPNVRLQSQHRFQFSPKIRRKFGIMPGEEFDVFIIEEEDRGDGDGA